MITPTQGVHRFTKPRNQLTHVLLDVRPCGKIRSLGVRSEDTSRELLPEGLLL